MNGRLAEAPVPVGSPLRYHGSTATHHVSHSPGGVAMRRPPRQGRVLTATQERVLLHKYLTGDFPPQRRWTTIRALIRRGLLREDRQHTLVVTAQGQAYSETHLMDI